MANKIISCIFFLSSIFISTSVLSETALEAICSESMAQVSLFYETTPNIYKLKKQIYAEYKGVRLRDFLINQWLPKIKKTKNFTPNSFYVLKDKYTSQCVQFVSNK